MTSRKLLFSGIFLLSTVSASDFNADFAKNFLENAEEKKKSVSSNIDQAIKIIDTTKKDIDVQVDEVVKIIDATIKAQMKEFVKIGEEYKELQERSESVLLGKKKAMVAIYSELQPLDARLRTLYPDMTIWFDKLKQYIEDEKKNGNNPK